MGRRLKTFPEDNPKMKPHCCPLLSSSIVLLQFLYGGWLYTFTVANHVLMITKASRQNASGFNLQKEEWKQSINISSANFADYGQVVVGFVYKDLHQLLQLKHPIKERTGITRLCNFCFSVFIIYQYTKEVSRLTKWMSQHRYESLDK